MLSLILWQYDVAWAAPGRHEVMVETPFGTFDLATVDTLCRMERIFIGTITASTAYVKSTGWGAGQIFSTVTYSIERDIRGSGATFIWSQPGGRLGVHDSRAVGWPYPQRGARYLMALTTAKQPAGDIEVGDWLMGPNLWISPEVQLPPAAALTSDLEAVCASI